MSEAAIRLFFFFGIFAAMAAVELLVPRRDLIYGRGRRWMTNLGIVLTDSLVLRIVFPMAAVGVALWATENGYGLFSLLDMPLWLAAVLGFIILDFAIWAAHWASHKIPILWCVHKMHHADPDFDVTTALRFHPIEIIVSMIWKTIVVLAFGIPVIAVLVFEIVLNGAAMFNHANVKLPRALDRVLRLVIVTPDMHRVHHSVIQVETDSNYGFNFSVWDRVFGTYIAEPREGQTGMTIGLSEYQSEKPTQYIWSLVLPFKKAVSRPPRPESAASNDSVKADGEVA